MKNRGITSNLWQQTAGPPMEAAALSAKVETDVVVIGGGFTGCSAALHLVEAGAAVCLLEAETIGHGGSGRNVGLVNAGLWTPPDQIEATLGVTVGCKLNAALAAGPKLVFDLIERHSIDCEATRNGTLHCAHSPAGLADLQNRHAQQVARNAPVELLGVEETVQRTGSHGYHGALLDHRAGTIQPLAYVLGLARAARVAGAALHEHSPVTRYWQDGTGWQVETPQGSVTAQTLIQATNAYEWRVQPISTFTPVYYFQFATKPLSDHLRAAILAGGEGCWDTATVMSSFRMDASARLIVGSIGNLDGWGASIHTGWWRRKLRKLFPAVTDYMIEHAWCGRIAMTADHLPKVVEIGQNAVSIYGYSGRGIASGTVFGQAAARWALSGDPADFPLAPQLVQSEHHTVLKRIYYECGAALTHLVNARLSHKRA